MSVINISNKREVMWDMELADKVSGVELKMHKPQRKNIALVCDAPWEGQLCCYISVINLGDKYRIYYRGAGRGSGPQDPNAPYHARICVAESTDGITFTKPNVGIFEFDGSKDNNIVFEGNEWLDNFSVYYDENPNCPADAKFKALSLNSTKEQYFNGLAYYKSADGLNFEFVKVLPLKGGFDSFNLTFWDEKIGKYRLYFRDFHRKDGSDVPQGKHSEECIRDIRLVTSEDFENWSEPERICYTDGKNDIQYYTSGIKKYHRADIFYGTPTRYKDRVDEAVNYKYLPKLKGARERLMSLPEKRGGTAITDATLIVSRDGLLFNRCEEGYITPGIENGENWIYGDGYISHGMIETESDFHDEPRELSLYTFKGYRCRPLDMIRYTIRLDGFFSWYAKTSGGYILTKPLTFDGDKLSVNFETSGQGSLRIIICDTDGNAIDGYDSTTLFGNSVDRPVDFQKPLSELCGKPVRLKIELSDCELYSFVFEK